MVLSSPLRCAPLPEMYPLPPLAQVVRPQVVACPSTPSVMSIPLVEGDAVESLRPLRCCCSCCRLRWIGRARQAPTALHMLLNGKQQSHLRALDDLEGASSGPAMLLRGCALLQFCMRIGGRSGTSCRRLWVTRAPSVSAVRAIESVFAGETG